MERNAAAFDLSEREAKSIRLMAALRRAANLFQRQIDAHARPLDLSLGRVNVLFALNGSPAGSLPLYAVAAILDVTRGNVSSLVQSLADDGFVATEPDPDDGRSLFVRLTPAGRMALREYAPTHYDLVARLSSDLSVDDLAQLTDLLHRLLASARAKS